MNSLFDVKNKTEDIGLLIRKKTVTIINGIILLLGIPNNTRLSDRNN